MPEQSPFEQDLLESTGLPPRNVDIKKQLLDLLNRAKCKNTTGTEFSEVFIENNELDGIYKEMEDLIKNILL